jgi:glycosyltransferase involved in cell wall biosynthesis
MEKTILITSPYFPPAGGGLERYALQVATYLNRDFGWRVVMVCSNDDWNGDKKEELSNMTVYHLARDMRVSNTPFALEWGKKMKKVIGDEKPDIINIHTPVPGLGDIASFVGRNIPQVVTYHTGSMKKGNHLDLFISPYERLVLPLMLRRAQAIICSSDFVRSDFLKRYEGKSETVTPGVNAEFFVPTEEKEAGNRTMIFVAKLESGQEYKGLKELLDALAILKELIPDMRLIVAGDGDMRKEYESYAEDIGVKDMTDFRGNLDRKRLRAAYQEARVFALPTSNDSQPLVILEAMSSGLPIVSTRIGGIPAMVEDGGEGLLVEPHDTIALADSIRILFQDPELQGRFSRNARKRAEDEFSWKSRMKRYDGILERALQGSEQ